MLVPSVDLDGGLTVFSFVSTRRLANCVISLKPGNSLGNIFLTSTCYLSQFCAAIAYLSDDTLIVNWCTQGTELKYAASVHGSCLFLR